MKRIKVFEADDGEQFGTKEACALHDQEILICRLCGLDEKAVRDGMERRDLKLAKAFEHVGNIVGAKRRAAGEFNKRGKKTWQMT